MDVITADNFAGIVARALERMAFFVAEPRDDAPAQLVGSCGAHAAIDLRGTPGYELCVSATAELVREVASGMLGIEAEEVDAAHHGPATVAELANVFGGELMMLLTGGESEMSLGLPRDVTADVAAAIVGHAATDGFCVVVGSGAGRLLLAARRA